MFKRRSGALKQTKQFKNEFSEHCDFCILSFHTRESRNEHILTHFEKKMCSETGKTMLCIADDWFELHTHDCIPKQQTEELNFELISDKSSRVINHDPTHINDEKIKKEENNVDSNNFIVTDEINIKDEIDSDTEMNFDTKSFTSSDSEALSNVSKFESREKETKINNKSIKTRRKKVPSTTKIKTSEEISSVSKVVKQCTKSKSIKCRICKLKISKLKLLEHLQSRHIPKINEIPKCETCGKTFSTPGNLRSHQYLHAERGRYICSYCGKDFVRNINLKEHINLHTGARPFVCEICKKTFHRETLLINHRRVHTGEKKYRCNIEDCDRAYMFDIDLKRHKFSAHGIYSKKHPCFICSKIFSENKLLKKHLETHS